MQSRRDFLASLSAAGAAGVLGARGSLADEPAAGDDHDPAARRREHLPCARSSSPTTCCARRASPTSATCTLRSRRGRKRAWTPRYLLSASVQTMLRAAKSTSTPIRQDPWSIRSMRAARSRCWPGVHSGCYELFAHEPIRTISDLKGKSVGVPALGSSRHLLPRDHGGACRARSPEGHRLGRQPSTIRCELFVDGKIDAFLGFPPEPQELRARKIGRVILNTTIGPPVVAVLLLHAGRQPRVRPQVIRSRPSACCAPSSRPPTCAPPSRSASRAGWSMAASPSDTTTRCRR